MPGTAETHRGISATNRMAGRCISGRYSGVEVHAAEEHDMEEHEGENGGGSEEQTGWDTEASDPFPAEKEEVEAVADDVERLRERMVVLDRLVNQAYEESDALDSSLPFVMPANRDTDGGGENGDT